MLVSGRYSEFTKIFYQEFFLDFFFFSSAVLASNNITTLQLYGTCDYFRNFDILKYYMYYKLDVSYRVF